MISFHDLKNYIVNDPLSDWFEKINDKYNAYESTEPTKFELTLRDKKHQYKENFIEFLIDTNLHTFIHLDYDSVKKRINSKTGQMACIYIGNNQTYEMMIESWCPKQYKCIYNPWGKEPNIDDVINSLNNATKGK